MYPRKNYSDNCGSLCTHLLIMKDTCGPLCTHVIIIKIIVDFCVRT